MILLIVAGIFTAISAFTSVWRIDLTAPQYPEGMVLYIGGLDGVSGGDEGNDLYKINELNHYVGVHSFAHYPWCLCCALFSHSIHQKQKAQHCLFSSIWYFWCPGIC